MIQVFRIDSNGFLIEPVAINDNDPIPIDCVTLMPPDGLFKPQLVNGNWVEGEDAGVLLKNVQQNKIKELNGLCNQTILSPFAYQYSDGNTYFFYNDITAQANFDKLLNAFNGSMIDSISWTAYDSDGNVVRLIFDSTSFIDLYKAHLMHIQSNISKFRDDLQPKVEAITVQNGDAQSAINAVNAIVW